MAYLAFSAFCRRASIVVGCVLTLSVEAVSKGRHVLPGHVPKNASKLKPIGTLPETNRLTLALGLPMRNQAELTAFVRDLYDPASTNFHRYLKPQEFTERFGPTQEDYAALSAFALAHGLRVVHTHANRLVLDVEGPVANVQEAFGVHLNLFQHPSENRTFYAPDSEPSVDASLPLLHVAGLDNFLLPKSNMVKRTGSGNHTAVGSGSDGTYMGKDFRAAYVPGVTLNGAGQTVGLVEFDTYSPKDITKYESMASLPNVPVTPVPIDSFTGPPGSGQGEVSLDIELSISMAPGLAQILVYEAPYGFTSVNDDLLDQIAEDDFANQIACCWLFAIDPTTDLIFLEMAAQGQSFYTASGDYGAYDINPMPLESDPNITIIGGTTLSTSGVGGAWQSETVWNWFNTGEGTSASSGGISSTYAIPYWQQSVSYSSNQGSVFWRNLPDVSMTGDNVFVYSDGGEETVGGTSCATPLWAAFTALINQQAVQNGRPPVGFLAPAIYSLAQSSLYPSLFHDITTGNNTNYNSTTQFFAKPGYDLCTGWGTPIGAALINALAPPDSLELLPKGALTFATINDYPLPIESQTLAFKSTGGTNIAWELGTLPGWLGASVSNGTVAANTVSFMTLSANDSATNLPPGNYVTNFLVTNLTAGVTHVIPVYLTVYDPLFVTPGSGMTVIGPTGGPFSETTETYALTNFGAETISWTAQSGLPYLDFSPSSGMLAAGDSTNVIVTLDPSFTNLLIASLTSTLSVTDVTTTNTQSQPVTFAIGNGGFETGDFSDWTFNGGASFTNFVGEGLEWLDYIHSGSYAALLGEPYVTATLSQSLHTAPGQLYRVSLFLNNPVGGEPNEFQVKWGGTTLFSQANVPLIEWTNMEFAVFATNAATTLELVFRNDPDYFGLDDISVTAAAPVAFSSATFTNNSFYFSWNAIPGAMYQLQYSTDLVTWGTSGHHITATNSIMTAKETLSHSEQQEYYRLYLLAN